MASVIRHATLKTNRIFTQIQVISHYATKAEKKKGVDRKVPPKLEWTADSLAAKGFLRPQKDYTPPNDLENKLNAIFENKLGNKNQETKLGANKYVLLNACYEELQHSVPNSILHTVETVGDVIKFYATPICTKTPLDKMKSMDLPPNLHVQYDYYRFNPADKKFGGVTAFPGSSTLVTGLKNKGRYKGHKQELKWPHI